MALQRVRRDRRLSPNGGRFLAEHLSATHTHAEDHFFNFVLVAKFDFNFLSSRNQTSKNFLIQHHLVS
jgi:hypothetical protein